MSNWISRLFHLDIPATVDEGVVTVPSFTVPLEDAPCVEGTIAIEVEPETKAAVVKVALKKKVKPKVVKKGKK